jgi:hypothetical protein
MIAALVAAAACASCHPDVAAQWSQSAHRFASFNNPYYAVSARAFRRERGEKAFLFCARCHDPALVEAKKIGRKFDESAPDALAGIACEVCHSIRDTHGTGGNGHYVRAEKPAHAELRPALLSTAQFCSTCHKVALTPDVTHDIWFRGQDDYDPWQASAIAGQGAGAPRRPTEVKRCQDCHMPLEAASANERGAHGGLIRSHRFLAANAALPHLRGDADAEARVREFLRGAVSVELVTTRVEGGLLADVVLRNRRVGHRFPGGTNDSNQVWLDVEILEGNRVIARNADHLIRAQPVDGDGRPLLKRDPQHQRAVVWDTSITPADPQVVRYRLDSAPAGKLRVRARVRYRKFTDAYGRSACATCADIPVIDVGEGERAEGDDARSWEAWLDHGLGLADGLTERAGEALPSLERARAGAPGRVEPLLGLARLALAEGRTEDVLALGAQVAGRAPSHPAAYWLRARALAYAYRQAEAVPFLATLVTLVPNDREAWVQLGRARSVAGDAPGALEAAERVLAVDSESYDGHHLKMLALRALGRGREAAAEEALYLFHRRRHERDLALRAKYEALFPQRADEAYPAHVHVMHQEPEGSLIRSDVP